jgi:hypothetical protein
VISPHLRIGGEPLSHQAKRGVTPIAKPEKVEKTPMPLKRAKPLERRVPPRAAQRPSLKRTQLGRTTPEQKQRVAGRRCLVCAEHAGHCHPAHVIPRGHPKMTDVAADDTRAVVPLCFAHHRQFDDAKIDLLPYLEPEWRDAQEWAAGAVGLAAAMRSITGGAA